MSITCGSKRIDTDKMEWHLGGANLINQYNNTHILDSDDESDKDVDPEEYIENNPDFQKNPLKILASRSEVASHKKKQNTYATSLAEIIDTQTDKTKRDLGKLPVCRTKIRLGYATPPPKRGWAAIH
jgi:hypothetical protein